MLPSHPSIRALLEADGGNDPVAAIRGRARILVSEMTALGWEGPPFDMELLASYRRLKVSRSFNLSNDQDACVMPGRVLVNARRPTVRQRYSVAHEVGHTLFPDYEASLRRVGRLWRRNTDDSEFERLCQLAAAEFLFPLEPFRASVTRRGFHLLGVLDLAREFDGSVEATARRTVEMADFPAVVLFLRPIDAATGDWYEVRIADGHCPYAPIGVSLVCSNEACGALQIERRTRPPKGAAAERAWKRVALAKGYVSIEACRGENWLHAGVEGIWDSEAITLPKGIAVPHEVLCLMRQALP